MTSESLTSLMTQGSWVFLRRKKRFGRGWILRRRGSGEECFAIPKRFLWWRWFEFSEPLILVLTRKERALLGRWLQVELASMLARNSPGETGTDSGSYSDPEMLRSLFFALSQGKNVSVELTRRPDDVWRAKGQLVFDKHGGSVKELPISEITRWKVVA